MNQLLQHDLAFEFIWSQYRIWTATAQKLKKELTAWRTAFFALIMTGAFTAILSQTIAAEEGETISKALGWISAVAIGFSGYAGSKILASEKEKRWTQACAAAERCKSDAFLYLLQVPPYNKREDDALLFYRIENLIRSLYTIPQVSITKAAELEGIPPSSYSFYNYLEERIIRQGKDYYLPKAALYKKYIKSVSRWGIVLGLAGFLLGALGASGTFQNTSVWVAFVSTVSASLTSFITANRYQYLAMSFQAMANQLRLLGIKGSRITTDDLNAQKDFIKHCETIFSTENETRITELSKEESRDKVKKRTPSISNQPAAAP